mmetsp:Transcript_7196/g.20872  ORF Transcript_7196/g.20872 Transcript_7196/m.20872 type:complete len:492 (+) Transcript_7196:373-1848(+)
MFPSPRPTSPPVASCPTCEKLTDARELIRVHAKTWKDCLGGVSQEVCCDCLVGYDIPVIRLSTGSWEFGTVLSRDHHQEGQEQTPSKEARFQVEFIDKAKEYVCVGNNPYETYADEMMAYFISSKKIGQQEPTRDKRQELSVSPVMMDSSDYDSHRILLLSENSPRVDSPFRKAAPNYQSQDPLCSEEQFSHFSSLLNETTKIDSSSNETYHSPIIRRSPVGKTVEPKSPFDSQISSLCSNSPARSLVSSDDRESRGSSITSSLRTPRLWTPDEDKLLLTVIGTMKNSFCWPEIALEVPDRTGKQCRERYLNHLGPHLKHTAWTPLEDVTIFRMHASHGSKWSQIVKFLPGRTDNGIKNRYHHLRRRFQKRIKSGHASEELKKLVKRIEESRSYRSLSPDALVVKYTAMRILNGASNTLKIFKDPTVGDGEYEFGPFRQVEESLVCARCGLVVPSKQTGSSVCTKTGWCKTCTGVSVVVSGDLLRLIHMVR